ncbi:hypothetical protein [Streptomyces sp. NPDC088785]|uniref:hypothetical protein n=1 Tax=Streptomyces sp. NPDC088785 TaxID=3365897 RepID=UPI0037F4A68B
MGTSTGPEDIRPQPDYPPKTPPPPRHPPSPPPPEPPRSESEQLLIGLPVPQRASHRTALRVMKNRHGASWTLESGPWIPKKAAGHVGERLGDWGLAPPAALDEVVRLLTATVGADGGRRISVHLSEQDGRIVVLALSHRNPSGPLGDEVLPALRGLGAVSCGSETTDGGRQVWALLDLGTTGA